MEPRVRCEQTGLHDRGDNRWFRELCRVAELLEMASGKRGQHYLRVLHRSGLAAEATSAAQSDGWRLRWSQLFEKRTLDGPGPL